MDFQRQAAANPPSRFQLREPDGGGKQVSIESYHSETWGICISFRMAGVWMGQGGDFHACPRRQNDLLYALLGGFSWERKSILSEPHGDPVVLYRVVCITLNCVFVDQRLKGFQMSLSREFKTIHSLHAFC